MNKMLSIPKRIGAIVLCPATLFIFLYFLFVQYAQQIVTKDGYATQMVKKPIDDL